MPQELPRRACGAINGLAIRRLPSALPRALTSVRAYTRRSALTGGRGAHRHLRDTLRLLLVFAHDQVFAHNRNGTVTYVHNCYDLTEDQVFVAYDTADDVEMLRTPTRAIFVRNFDDELDSLPEICSRTAVPE